ncbi:MAG TPA: GNAT family N-acetyltransferase [Ktedonobacteraceae bacterium]|nr:GNAT family N-acetyltransferase [Ktedonobacteraceae bacterium]
MITEKLPRGLTMRHPTMADLEAVTDVIRSCEVALDGTAETTLDDIRTGWQMPGFDLTKDAWLVFSDEGKVVGLAGVEHREHARLYTGGEVHPDYRNRGIGTYLLHLGEERARQHIPLAPSGARVTLNCGANSKDEAKIRLLEEHGFTRVRYFWRMAIEMDAAPPTPQWAEGITLRTFTPEMTRAVYEADEEAFKDHWGHVRSPFDEWEHWTVKRKDFDPTLWFLAMDGDEIAGISLCQDEKESGGWVHVLGVRRPWRRKGVGLALLYHSFGEFYKRDIRNVYLGVDAQSLTGATRLYERAGMHVIRQYNSYEKELRAGKELSTQFIDGKG